MTYEDLHHGKLIVIVGPSGAGKDTLITEVLKDEELSKSLQLVKRTVTRKASKDAEDFISLSEEEFLKAKADDAFCVTWQAHDLYYGVDRSALNHVKSGGYALFNGARRVLLEIKDTFTHVVVINITANPDVLAERLQKRGRENTEAVIKRLKQQNLNIDPSFLPINIDNSGPLDVAVEQLKQVLMTTLKTPMQQEIEA